MRRRTSRVQLIKAPVCAHERDGSGGFRLWRTPGRYHRKPAGRQAYVGGLRSRTGGRSPGETIEKDSRATPVAATGSTACSPAALSKALESLTARSCCITSAATSLSVESSQLKTCTSSSGSLPRSAKSSALRREATCTSGWWREGVRRPRRRRGRTCDAPTASGRFG